MFEKIHLYQVVVVCISSVMIFQGIKEFINRESGQTWLKLFVRLIVWGGMMLVALYPDFTILVSRLLGIQDNFNAVVLTGFIMVFLIIFKLLSAIEKIEQNVSEITRKESLREASSRIATASKSLSQRKAQSEDE